MSFQEPSPHTSAAVWQGPRGHLKRTTMEKINLASSLQLQREEEIEKGGEGPSWKYRSGIPILANCFVGRLPENVL